MSHLPAFEGAFAKLPLIAILRGVRPDEVEAIGEALVGAGITLIEVPLNSPDPFESIGRLSKRLAGQAVVGAGTVLTPRDVAAVAAAGGQMIVSPNADRAVIEASVAAGLASLPGIFTPSEAFAALAVGATALKLFPAEALEPVALQAMRAVLPAKTRILPVGGIDGTNISLWRKAGAAGFGLGSSLYRAGRSSDDVLEYARDIIAAWGAE
jgi:2-dehydro-3-deoxyphosphogalactonate aldolase